MYRIKSIKGKPLIISSKILKDYSLEKVDTLHLKNLLMLGEDRYLTTLMLSSFPYSKICFNVKVLYNLRALPSARPSSPTNGQSSFPKDEDGSTVQSTICLSWWTWNSSVAVVAVQWDLLFWWTYSRPSSSQLGFSTLLTWYIPWSQQHLLRFHLSRLSCWQVHMDSKSSYSS